MGQILELSTGNASQGPAGPPGPSTSSTPAPNVTSGTVVVSYQINGSAICDVIFSGVITLPTSDPQYDHLRSIQVMAVSPAGMSTLIATVQSATTYPTTPFGSSTMPYSGVVEPQPLSMETWSVQFIAVNEVGSPTSPPVSVTGVTVNPPGHPIASGAVLTVTNTQGSAPTQANIFMGLNGANSPYWQLAISLDTPGNGDFNAFYYAIWVQWVSAASGGSPINPGGVGNTSGWTSNVYVPNDGVAHASVIAGSYPAAGVDGYFQISVYALNRVASPTFTPTGSAPYSSDPNIVLQTTTPNAFHVGPPPSGNSSNMLANPSFNQPSLVGWQTAPASGTSYAAFSSGGVNYAQVSMAGNPADIYQTFNVRQLDSYVFELWIAVSSGSGACELGINWINSSGAIISSVATTVTGLTGTVAPFSVSGAAPSHTVTMQVVFAVGTGVTATFLLTNGYLAPATGAGHARAGNVSNLNPGPGLIITPQNLVVPSTDTTGNVVLNPAFETGDTQGWHPGTGATLGVTSSTILTGGFSGTLLPGGASLGQGDMIQGSPGTNYTAPAAPGSQWFVAFDVNCASGGGSIDLWLECFGLSGFISSVVSPSISAPTSGWQHMQCVLTIPTGTGITEFVAVMRVTGWTASSWIIDNVVCRPALSTDGATLVFNSTGQMSVPIDGTTITVNPDGTVASVAVPGANMLANPGAENGLAWWSNPSANPFISTNAQHAPGPGSRSFSLAGVTTGTSNLVSPALSALSGQIFTASCAMLGDTGNLNEIALNVNFFNSSGTLLSSNTVALQLGSIPTGWLTLSAGTGVSISQIAAPANTAYVALNVTVLVLSGSAGNLYIDNIQLIRCTDSVTTGNASVGAAATNLAAINAATGALAAQAAVINLQQNGGSLAINNGINVFTGAVYLSQGTAAPVVALLNTGIFLYGTAGSGNTGLTSAPYVAIQSSGILVASSSTGPSAYLSGAGLFLYAVTPGSLGAASPNAYAQLTAGGGLVIKSSQISGGTFNGYWLETDIAASGIILQLTNGSAVNTQMVLSSTQLTMSVAGTTYLTMNSSGIAVIGSLSATSGGETFVAGPGISTPLGTILGAQVSDSSQNVFITSGGVVACTSSGASGPVATHSAAGYEVVNGGNTTWLRHDFFRMDALPSSSPGAGTKKFWYDPSDGNRVKFAA